ncbi:MAG: hypothetical protein V6Z89_14580 [Desulfobacter sp.]
MIRDQNTPEGPFIYLGPQVRTHDIHFELNRIYRQLPQIPEALGFLKPLFVPVGQLGNDRAEHIKQYRYAASKLRQAANNSDGR